MREHLGWIFVRRYESWRELPDPEARDEARITLALLGDWSPAWEEVLMPPRDVAEQAGFDVGGSRERWLHYAGWALIRRIQQQGLQTHLVIAKGHVEGNHRLAAALYLGLPVVPVYLAVDVETRSSQKQ
jgi:hypothetical protein